MEPLVEGVYLGLDYYGIQERSFAYMSDNIEDKDKYHRVLPHEEWCDLLSTLEINDANKRDAVKINKYLNHNFLNESSDCESSLLFPCNNNKTRTSNNPVGMVWFHKHGVIQRYFIICKKDGMMYRKYISQRS